MSETNKNKLGERGLVSFMVTLIMMAVITLIVLGFAQVTRRNERESLDRQLSSQAFYAAESGVNVTRSTIASYITSNDPTTLQKKTSCKNEYKADAAGGDSGTPIVPVDSGTNVAYTCVLVDPNPSVLSFSSINETESLVTPIRSSAPLGTLTFSWPKQLGTTDSDCTSTGPTKFPPHANWTCGQGILRMELVDMSAGATSNAQIDTMTKIMYLTPMGGHSGAVTIGGSKVYVASAINCNTLPAKLCSVTITLPGTSASYLVRMNSIYRSVPSVDVAGTLAGSGVKASFSGVQAVVDVTGKAQDQLRRIKARVALTAQVASSHIPMAALSSNADICKNFGIAPGDTLLFTSVCN